MAPTTESLTYAEACDREHYSPIYFRGDHLGATYLQAGHWHSLRNGKARRHASLADAVAHLMEKAGLR